MQADLIVFLMMVLRMGMEESSFETLARIFNLLAALDEKWGTVGKGLRVRAPAHVCHTLYGYAVGEARVRSHSLDRVLRSILTSLTRFYAATDTSLSESVLFGPCIYYPGSFGSQLQRYYQLSFAFDSEYDLAGIVTHCATIADDTPVNANPVPLYQAILAVSDRAKGDGNCWWRCLPSVCSSYSMGSNPMLGDIRAAYAVDKFSMVTATAPGVYHAGMEVDRRLSPVFIGSLPAAVIVGTTSVPDAGGECKAIGSLEASSACQPPPLDAYRATMIELHRVLHCKSVLSADVRDVEYYQRKAEEVAWRLESAVPWCMRATSTCYTSIPGMRLFSDMDFRETKYVIWRSEWSRLMELCLNDLSAMVKLDVGQVPFMTTLRKQRYFKFATPAYDAMAESESYAVDRTVLLLMVLWATPTDFSELVTLMAGYSRVAWVCAGPEPLVLMRAARSAMELRRITAVDVP